MRRPAAPLLDEPPARDNQEAVAYEQAVPISNTNAAETKFFRALADPSRRAIFESLTRGEGAVKDLTAQFDISRPAVSQRVASLRDVGLVNGRSEGRKVDYRVEPAGLLVDLEITHDRETRRSSSDHRTPTEFNAVAHAQLANVDRGGTVPLERSAMISYPWSSTGSSVRFAVHGGPATVAKG